VGWSGHVLHAWCKRQAIADPAQPPHTVAARRWAHWLGRWQTPREMPARALPGVEALTVCDTRVGLELTYTNTGTLRATAAFAATAGLT